MKGFRRHALSVAIPLLLLSWGGTAAAQSATPESNDDTKQDARTLDKVVVTAERRDEPLQTTPLSATVLSGDDLEKWGVSVVDQLQFATPSATVNNFGQGIDFNIRGIGKAEHNTQTTTGVITYRDGVATFPGYFAGEPYYDIASVEVLRGPQGTFVGQNATGGAVFVTSKDPVVGGEVEGYVAGQLGNYSDVAVQGAINLPIGKTLAARISVNGENRDSFWDITGPWTGSDARLRSRSARLGLLWTPSEALSVLFKTDYNDLDMGAYPSDPVNSTNDLFDITANAEMKAHDRFTRSVLKLDYRFANGIKFRSTSGYQQGQTAYAADLDGTSIRNTTFRDVVDETIWSQEFNLISPDEGRINWILGAYWQKDTYTFLPGEFVIGAPPGSAASEYRLEGTNPKKTSALFGQVGFNITDKLELELGGRYAHSETSNDVDVLQYGTPIKALQTAKFKNFSGKVALNYEVDANHFLYAFAATGFRPGGLNVPVGFGIPAPFEGEKVQSFELGWKATWLDGRVRTQLNTFYNNYDNFQVTIGYPQLPVFGFELNVPETTKMHGFEAQVQAYLGKWQIDSGLGILSSKLGQFYATDPRGLSLLPCNPETGPASVSCINLKGRDQTYAPELTFNLGVQRGFTVGTGTITPRITYSHVSEQWATLFQNEARGDRIESRNIVTAQIAWQRGDWLVTLYGTNLTDQRYVAAINSGLRFAGAPRQFGLRATKWF